MAAISNTFKSSGTNGAAGNREDLSNVVNRISPEDTPLYTMMGKGTCTSTYPEWEIDELGTPGENAQAEGDLFAFQAVTAVKRMGNATQIFKKQFGVSKTQDQVSNAGAAEQTKYQTLKKGVEIRKDVEFAIIANTATNKADTRKLGALPTWLETNTDRGPGNDANNDDDFTDTGDTAPGADGGYKSSDGQTDVYVEGVQRAFTKSMMDGMMESVYKQGGNVKTMVLSPYAKRVFSSFMSNASVAQQRTETKSGQASIIGAADMYTSDYGTISVVPNRVMGTNSTVAKNVYFIDPSLLEFKWLRPISKVADVAKTADATPTVIIGEGTLCVKNEKGLGVVGDIFGTTATS